MSYLLDTHLLLGWLADDTRLSQKARAVLADGRNAVFVSAATAWEIAMKRQLGKLDAPVDLEGALAKSRFLPLAVQFRHAVRAGALPPHHTDPFDRMTIAQAQSDGLILLTHDRRLKAYGPWVSLV